MGTRHLISVYSEGEYKVAQYGQWDGCPDGQGVSVLNFLRGVDFDRFKKSLHNVSWITDEEWKQRWLQFGHNVDEGDGFVSSHISDMFCRKYPELDRDTGAKILNFVYGSTSQIKLSNHIDFANDSLFCEWAYVIDLDNNTFEVYEGFNQFPLNESERFYSDVPKDTSVGEKYYPVKMVTSFELNNLPTAEEFINFFKLDEDESTEFMGLM